MKHLLLAIIFLLPISANAGKLEDWMPPGSVIEWRHTAKLEKATSHWVCFDLEGTKYMWSWIDWKKIAQSEAGLTVTPKCPKKIIKPRVPKSTD